ncbi:MAG: LLM class F420-dependent oxidoreductase [Acidimicrobiales bacterium]|nr:LLM class F420-dependent oxidoreductase [Acidimicrobiales bacterium]
MRIGLMVGPERRRHAQKVQRLIDDVIGAEAAGFSSVWIPQVPDDFDAMTAAAVTGARTSRIEIGTAVVVLQSRHPVALAQQALSTQAVCEGRFTLGVGPSHGWVIKEMLGLDYDRPAVLVRSYLDVLDAAGHGPGPVDVDNEHFSIHNPLDITDIAHNPILIAALGPVMLRLAGERADGTLLWMADERTIGDHIAPRITTAAESAGRPAPRIVAGVPVCLCRDDEVDTARQRANRVLAEADISPNYQRLMDHGDARNVADILAAGSEAAVMARLRSFKDAGVTDLSVRVLPIGEGRNQLLESSRRTREFLSTITPAL